MAPCRPCFGALRFPRQRLPAVVLRPPFLSRPFSYRTPLVDPELSKPPLRRHYANPFPEPTPTPTPTNTSLPSSLTSSSSPSSLTSTSSSSTNLSSTSSPSSLQALDASSDPNAFSPRLVFAPPDGLVRTYYPGHHERALKTMRRTIDDYGLVIECRDLRVPVSSANPLLDPGTRHGFRFDRIGEEDNLKAPKMRRYLGGDHGGRFHFVVYTKCDLAVDPPAVTRRKTRQLRHEEAQKEYAEGIIGRLLTAAMEEEAERRREEREEAEGKNKNRRPIDMEEGDQIPRPNRDFSSSSTTSNTPPPSTAMRDADLRQIRRMHHHRADDVFFLADDYPLDAYGGDAVGYEGDRTLLTDPEDAAHAARARREKARQMSRKQLAHLLRGIRRVARQFAEKHVTGLRVLIVGMPNVGKSTLLNRLRAAGMHNVDYRKTNKVAATGADPGVTRRLATPVQILGPDEKHGVYEPVYAVDSPGVSVPYLPDPVNMIKLALVGSVKPGLVPPLVLADFLLFQLNRRPDCCRRYCRRYALQKPTNNLGVLLQAIGLRTGRLGRHGQVEDIAAAEVLIQDWRHGRLGRFCLDEIDRPISEVEGEGEGEVKGEEADSEQSSRPADKQLQLRQQLQQQPLPSQPLHLPLPTSLHHARKLEKERRKERRRARAKASF